MPAANAKVRKPVEKTTSDKRTRPDMKPGSKANVRSKPVVDSRIRMEIALLVVFGLSVIILISNFGVGGVVGGAISSFVFGLFGFPAYFFPVLLFLGTAFAIANRNNVLIVRKMGGAVAVYIFFCAFTQLLMFGYKKGISPVDCYVSSANEKLGGGLIGGSISQLIGSGFGIIGAYVIVIIALVIAAIIMTQKPLLGTLKVRGQRVADTAKSKRFWQKSIVDPDAEDTEDLYNESDFIPGSSILDFKADEIPKQEKLDLSIHKADDSDDDPWPNYFDLKAEGESPFSEAAPAERGMGAAEPSTQTAVSEADIHDIEKEVHKNAGQKHCAYKYPPLSLLKKGTKKGGNADRHLRETAAKLQQTLRNFGVNVTVTDASQGPTVTRYEICPEQGVKVSRIVSLSDDIKLNLAVPDIRIEAPIPGKAAVGIEVPNEENSAVMLRDLLQTEEFRNFPSKLAFATGKDIGGKAVISDIARMPHLLIAGATGSGKSVCINTLIMSILYKADPSEVKLIMIDPKVVELSVYNGIPHLYIPVVTDPKKAAGALNWAVAEMTRRYNRFAEYNVRDLSGYNEKVSQMTAAPSADTGDQEEKPEILPQIVIIVDELADLMMVAPGEVEDAICRLAQLARAAGIHLIIATQRPSVNVITGLIKANMPSRIAFAVSSGVDSRTILDMNGAEKLLGKGDMLFYPQNYPKPVRLQGAFVSDREVSQVVDYLLKQTNEQSYDEEVVQQIENAGPVNGASSGASAADEVDTYFAEAGKTIIEKDKASIGMLQRMFKIGFNRAARIMDQLCDAGVVGEEEGTKPRKILMTMDEFEEYLSKSG